MSRRKTEIVWGIRQYGLLLPFLTRPTRKQAIADTCERRAEKWAYLRRSCGFTVHKLEVRDVR